MNLFKIVPLSVSLLLSVSALQALAQMPPKMDEPVSQTVMPPVMEQATPELPADIPVEKSSGNNVETTTAPWVVITGSYSEAQFEAALKRRDGLRDAGYDALIIDSYDYPKLTDGLWVVVLEEQSRAQALAMVENVQAEVPDAYAKSLE